MLLQITTPFVITNYDRTIVIYLFFVSTGFHAILSVNIALLFLEIKLKLLLSSKFNSLRGVYNRGYNSVKSFIMAAAF